MKYGIIERWLRINQLRSTIDGMLKTQPANILADIVKDEFIDEIEKIEFGVIEGYPAIANPIDKLQKSAIQRSTNMLARYKRIEDPDEEVRRNISVLENIAQTIVTAGAKPVFVRPPTTRLLRDRVKQITFLERLKDSKPIARNAIIFDAHTYFDPSLSTGNNIYFFDSNHLNLTGAKKFSLALREAL